MLKYALTALLLLSTLMPVLVPTTAQAYFSTMDTGEVTQPGHYRTILEPQFILNKYDGVNLIGRFDTGLADDKAVRAIVGFGEVDFQLGAFYKWIPFPDSEGQPAIGGSAGVLYGRAGDETELSLRFHPLVSKHFETEIGDLTPFVSLPLGITTRDDDTFVPIQLAVGSEWKTLNWENLRFMAELGLNINKAFSYLSFGLVYEFDEASLRK
ncbi:MAG: hypothetical protein NDI61_04035 [Bdellovibrionaceae bacterium]|nr:hypothetical protein [Pseudobdellovibrionaceae bacterium]